MQCISGRIILVATFLIFSSAALAHKGHHHSHGEAGDGHAEEKEVVRSQAEKEQNLDAKKLEAINKVAQSYQQNIQPIFDKKCNACHSATAEAPWYRAVPLVHGLIENDRKEAQEHLETSKGFPFAGHGSPVEDLQAIADSVRENSMPPLRYKIVHWSSALTSDEKTQILSWVNGGIELLK